MSRTFLNPRFLLACPTRGVHAKPHSKSPTHLVTFVRHGESTWNICNLFTGWYDAPLTNAGIAEAEAAGRAVVKEDVHFDVVFTSKLGRTKETAKIIVETSEQCVDFVEDYRLNERHYGALTGYNKNDLIRRFGKKQVMKWRRGYETIPPAMTKDHPCYSTIKNTFPNIPIPKGESLKMTASRVIDCWRSSIVPEIRNGARVLVVTHNNALRGFIKYLDRFCGEEILKYNFGTGVPFTYTLDSNMRPVRNKRMQFLFKKPKCDS